MYKLFALTIILLLKFILPIGLILMPFVYGWANFLLDTIDGDLLIPLGLSDHAYQLFDKSADFVTYLCMILATRHFRWKIKNWIYFLFSLRVIGQIAFFIFADERIFFLFPNFLEPLFLVYSTIYFFKKAKTYAFYLKHKIIIWTFVIIYKLQDEWIRHIGNIDRSDIIKKLFEKILSFMVPIN